MSDTTRVPAIPSPTDANLRDVARAIKGLLDVREGNAGDPLDRNVTFRDLVDGGVAGVSGTGGAGGRSPLSLIPVVIAPGSEDDGYDPTTDLSIPPPPQNFTVTGLFASVKLQWDIPQIRNYGYTEIWSSPNNVLGEAVLIGTSPSQMYLDYLGGSSSRYYWARFVTRANVVGPYNATNGELGQTSPDPELLLDLLTGQITQSQLYEDLGKRIDLIDGPSSLPNSVANRILAEAVERQAAITQESQTRQSNEESFAQNIVTLTAAVGSNAAAIQNESFVRATADQAEAAERNTLAARVTNAETGIVASQAAIESERITRATADSAIASSITTLDAKVGANTALIQQEATARATADSANASLINQVQARLDTGDYAAVKTQSSVSASKVSGLEAQYSVKIDLNGHVSGFGLSSTNANGAPTSAFIVRADRFALAGVGDPADGLGTLSPSRLPFVVSTTATVINGVSVPAGTYINTAFIGSATIKSAQIGSVYADTIQAGYTSSVDIESSTFYGSELYLGGTATYEYNDPSRPSQKTGISGVAGAKIALRPTGAEFEVDYFKIKNGSSLFTPFEVVGSVVRIRTAAIGDGTITDAKIANEIKSTNYVAGSQGWRIDKSGAAEFGASSIRGQLTASQIDTRGLTIKNSAGDVILGAGTALRVSDIFGLGAFATLSQIYSGNASTFIASGAIGSAQIGSASVGTLNIAGEAVMVPRFGSGVIINTTLTSDWSSDLVLVPFTISGLPGSDTARVTVMAVVQAYSGNNTVADLEVGIFADGNLNGSVASTFGGDGISVASIGSWLVGNSNYDASVRVRAAAGSGASSKADCTFIVKIIVNTAKR